MEIDANLTLSFDKIGNPLLINKATGEVITDNIEETLEKFQIDIFSKFSTFKRKLGIEEKRRIINKNSLSPKKQSELIKVDGEFIKIFKHDYNNLSKSECAFILKLFPFINWNTNDIFITKQRLREILNMSNPKVLENLKSLEKKNYIQYLTSNKATHIHIFFNPHYILCGKGSAPETYYKFKGELNES